MAPYQYIERQSPFNSKGGKTTPVFAVTPAHIEIGAIDPDILSWVRKAGFKAESGAVWIVPTSSGDVGGALLGSEKSDGITVHHRQIGESPAKRRLAR